MFLAEASWGFWHKDNIQRVALLCLYFKDGILGSSPILHWPVMEYAKQYGLVAGALG